MRPDRPPTPESRCRQVLPLWVRPDSNTSPPAALAGAAVAFSKKLPKLGEDYKARRDGGKKSDSDVSAERTILAMIRLFVEKPEALTGFQNLVRRSPLEWTPLLQLPRLQRSTYLPHRPAKAISPCVPGPTATTARPHRPHAAQVPRVFDIFLMKGTKLRADLCSMLMQSGTDRDVIDRIAEDDNLVRQPFFWSAPGALALQAADRARERRIARLPSCF